MLGTILALIRLGLGFAQTLTQYLAQKNLIDVGKAAAAYETMTLAKDQVDEALKVERLWRDMPASERERLRERFKRPPK